MVAESAYEGSGVDTSAGDRAVDLIRGVIASTQSEQVVGGLGGFAGLYDISEFKEFRRPILATSTDGVGTKVAIAQALDVHDTVGIDLVGMVIDDVVVVGAKPLFMTDYIACGSLVPDRISMIVGGIAKACGDNKVSLIGGETAEHPGLLGPNEYDLAGAATGIVEAEKMLDPQKVQSGDVAVAIGSSGLHSNGYSLVRKIVLDNKWDLHSVRPEFSRELGIELLEPTRIYSATILRILREFPEAIHMVSHVTGGGIAQNVSRVLPKNLAIDIDRSTWSPPIVMRVLADAGSLNLSQVEGAWNMGVGMILMVDQMEAQNVIKFLSKLGFPAWQAGIVGETTKTEPTAKTPSKGVEGGIARLVGSYS